jgi:hypothetical protein
MDGRTMNRFSSAVTVLMLAIFVTMVAVAATYSEKARFMPLVIGIPAICLCLLQLAMDLRGARRARLAGAVPGPRRDRRPRQGDALSAEVPASVAMPAVLGATSVASEIRTWTYFVAYIGGVLLFGFHVAVPILVAVYLFLEAKLSALVAGFAAAVFSLAVYLMFERLLEFRLHEGFLTERLIDAFAL